MKHPLQCPNCGEFRHIGYKGCRFEEGNKGYSVMMPYFECRSCGQFNSILPQDQYMEFKEKIMPSIQEGEFFDMPLKFIFSKIDADLKFSHYSVSEFEYDSRDYYLIPGLYREWDDGYLTPVFFDKDVLLYYNNHPDYTVRLTSFSSGNIYYKTGKPVFEWGFGINRSGKIFKWLGDLYKDFEPEEMKPHLHRFKASNIPSDHDVFSKFYLSQNPFSPSDAFQTSDNETRIFRLKNDFNAQCKSRFGQDITKIDIAKLSEYYKPPIMEEQSQIFEAYLALNKYFIENLQEKVLRSILLVNGLTENDLKKDGKSLGSLKLFTMFLDHGMKKPDANKLVSPLFVLSDLRQLHGHLSAESFESKYQSCKDRLGIPEETSHLLIYKTLVAKLILLLEGLIDMDE